MINNADPASLQVDISVVAIDVSLGGRSQVSVFCTPTAVGTLRVS